MTDDLAAIEAVLQTYFDGLHEGSVDKLGAVFHETADLRSVAADGALAVLTRAAWFEGVKSRPSPKSRDLARHDWIVTIDRSGPATACAALCAKSGPFRNGHGGPRMCRRHQGNHRIGCTGVA